MKLRRLEVEDCLEVTPQIRYDARGSFSELYRFDALVSEIGYPLKLAQINQSFSRRGVLRGLHYALTPYSQAKYVTCAAGAVLDFVYDVRVGSPTFGVWDAVVLDDSERKAVYLPEGVGHAFVALSETATVTYMCSTTYDPAREKGVNPLDRELGLEFPFTPPEMVLSVKDQEAPTLAEAQKAGLLPNWAECQKIYQGHREAYNS